jgi:prevent-host-death family protein
LYGLYVTYDAPEEHYTGRLGVSEARQGFAELVNRAAHHGERVRIERHGRAIAAIVPISDLEMIETLERRSDHWVRGGPSISPGARAIERLQRNRGHITMTTDEILALTRDGT